MDFQDIVIGSGLSALGTVLGLPADRRVLVIAGPREGQWSYYDGSRSVPCAHLSFGGLGNFWHGVIPTAEFRDYTGATEQDFEALFRRFYPRTSTLERLGQPWLFVPWQPIRPAMQWPRIVAERNGNVSLAYESAVRFSRTGPTVSVETASGTYKARRVWVCAGALHTPMLLERSMGAGIAKPYVSDHVISYLGQIDRAECPEIGAPPVARTRDGVWFAAKLDRSNTALCTLRPARFAFRKLDQSIEQREAFGLPTGSLIAKVLRSASPALVAEALYNKTGMFPNARVQSVYGQVLVPDAYEVHAGGTLRPRQDAILAAIEKVRAALPWPRVRLSRRPETFIPAIHLHHSVDLPALARAGANTESASVQVMDASVFGQPSPEHHSFKMMLAALVRARAISSVD